jgi:DNA gyrase subunit A
MLTKTGYVKRVPRTTYKSQRRGGKGVVGMTTKEEDEIEIITSATTHDTILFFTNKGKVFGSKAWDLPEATRQAKGQAIVNIINIDTDERIMSILPMREGAKHLIMSTAKVSSKIDKSPRT